MALINTRFYFLASILLLGACHNPQDGVEEDFINGDGCSLVFFAQTANSIDVVPYENSAPSVIVKIKGDEAVAPESVLKAVWDYCESRGWDYSGGSAMDAVRFNIERCVGVLVTADADIMGISAGEDLLGLLKISSGDWFIPSDPSSIRRQLKETPLLNYVELKPYLPYYFRLDIDWHSSSALTTTLHVRICLDNDKVLENSVDISFGANEDA